MPTRSRRAFGSAPPPAPLMAISTWSSPSALYQSAYPLDRLDHLLRGVPKRRDELVFRPPQPRDDHGGSAVLLLVDPAAPHVVAADPARLPVAHRVPLDHLVGPFDLVRSP